MIKIEGKYTKVYLRVCRRGKKEGCIRKFFTIQPNKMYCSAKCRRDSILESNRKARMEYKKRYPEKENSNRVGSVRIGPHMNPDLKKEQSIIKKEKRRTFLTHHNEKGKHKSTLSGAEFPFTHNDLPAFTISYLEDNQVRCPECENSQNLIEHALNICSKCGLVLKAPPIHVGYEVDDITPKKKICATVQDFPPKDFKETRNQKKKKIKPYQSIKKAHNKAYDKYIKESGLKFEEFEETPHKDYNDSLNPLYWRERKKNKAV